MREALALLIGGRTISNTRAFGPYLTLELNRRTMNKREFLELAGLASLAGGLILATIALIVLYIAALGAALGAFLGAAAWVFRAITG